MTSVEFHQDEQPLEYVARYGDREFRYHLCYVPEHKKATIRVHVHQMAWCRSTPRSRPSCQK